VVKAELPSPFDADPRKLVGVVFWEPGGRDAPKKKPLKICDLQGLVWWSRGDLNPVFCVPFRLKPAHSGPFPTPTVSVRRNSA
jgi:hypothetical protein